MYPFKIYPSDLLSLPWNFTKKMEESNEVQVTINRPTKIIHFSDGVDEEIEQEKATEVNCTVSNNVDDVNPQSGWMPWLSHYAWKSSSKMLNAVDYAGEGLANFFGITTPKYQIEIDEYERVQEEKKQLEEESAGWVPKNAGNDIPLVLTEPTNNPSKV
ncbi:protein FAM177A1-like [Aricia agestis]|uniref:protein FAM177A1-like n=1 Tax=Aricia agestis TaxID=91739 RepID=UPI001C208584|nr:protein FAM177A1-like [Aricia agestis]